VDLAIPLIFAFAPGWSGYALLGRLFGVHKSRLAGDSIGDPVAMPRHLLKNASPC
jgi:hypothetical protein